SSDDDNDDDVEKDKEDEEEEEHLAPVDPPTVPTDDPTCITEFAAALPSSSPPPENDKSLKDNIRETMTTVDQGMSVEEIERVIAERVANAIEAIAIYETKTNMARKSISQTEQQECKDPAAARINDSTLMASQKAICYECGNQGHYKRDCPERKNQSHKNQIGGHLIDGPSKMKELIEQLQERTLTKALIRPISSPWGALSLVCQEERQDQSRMCIEGIHVVQPRLNPIKIGHLLRPPTEIPSNIRSCWYYRSAPILALPEGSDIYTFAYWTLRKKGSRANVVDAERKK
ncbi:reverse transcriptase domain-containing protein, partial [Tanacetum coccineum]